MKKNKFNIGQVVIVLDNSKVTEKIVDKIIQKDGVLVYGLKGIEKRGRRKSLTYENMVEAHIRMSQSIRWPERAGGSRPQPIIVDDMDVKKTKFTESFKEYKESEIFEDEGDFRANIKIQTLPKEKSKKKAA